MGINYSPVIVSSFVERDRKGVVGFSPSSRDPTEFTPAGDFISQNERFPSAFSITEWRLANFLTVISLLFLPNAVPRLLAFAFPSSRHEN